MNEKKSGYINLPPWVMQSGIAVATAMAVVLSSMAFGLIGQVYARQETMRAAVGAIETKQAASQATLGEIKDRLVRIEGILDRGRAASSLPYSLPYEFSQVPYYPGGSKP